MAGCDGKKSLGAVWSACPLLGLSSRAGCENDHTWCPMSALIFCLCLSISPPCFEREPVIPPPSHTNTLSGTQRGRSNPETRKFTSTVCVFSAASFAFSSHKNLAHSLPAFTYGWDRQREVQKAPWPSQAAPFLLPSGFSTSEHRPPLCVDVLWNHSGLTVIKGWSVSLYLPLDVWSVRCFPCDFFFSSCFCELGSTWVGLVKEVLVKEIKGCKLPTLDWNLRSSFCFPSDNREEFLKQASVGLSFKSMLNQWWEALSLGCRCLTSIIVNVTVE